MVGVHVKLLAKVTQTILAPMVWNQLRRRHTECAVAVLSPEPAPSTASTPSNTSQSGPSSGRKWYFSGCFRDIDGFIQVLMQFFGIILGFIKKNCFGLKSSWFHPDIFEISD